MATFRTGDAQETRALGEALAGLLRAGDVLLLRGDLGAGKSELARGVARGLGIMGRVPSPSFTILQAYDMGRVPFYHFDWYRIGSAEEIYELSMEEMLGGDGVAAVEWPDNAPDVLPQDALDIRLTAADDGSRRVEMTPRGAFRDVTAALAEAWRAAGGRAE